jgi:uncharacterized protein YneF (UPF0154 family)
MNNEFSFIITMLMVGTIVLLNIIAGIYWTRSKRYTKSDLYRDNPHMRKHHRRRSVK